MIFFRECTYLALFAAFNVSEIRKVRLKWLTFYVMCFFILKVRQVAFLKISMPSSFGFLLNLHLYYGLV